MTKTRDYVKEIAIACGIPGYLLELKPIESRQSLDIERIRRCVEDDLTKAMSVPLWHIKGSLSKVDLEPDGWTKKI